MTKFFAKKPECARGHKHDSKAEAARCHVLHVRLALGEIIGLRIHPFFPFFIDGKPVKMANGHQAGYTADATYIENGKQVVEDVKPDAKGSFGQSRDFPLRLAMAKALYPAIIFRIVK